MSDDEKAVSAVFTKYGHKYVFPELISDLAELVALGRAEAREAAARLVLQMAATPAIDLDLRDRETLAAAIRKETP